MGKQLNTEGLDLQAGNGNRPSLFYTERTMKHIVLGLQIAALTASWSSNRADAMAAAAIFAVLCVVVVSIKGNAQIKRIAR